MLQPIVKFFQPVLVIVLLCAGPSASAQDDLISRGIEAFREACLMADPRSEKIYQWAADKDLKILAGQGPERAGIKVFTWEVARSGTASVLLRAWINNPGNLNCWVDFTEQRDSEKRVETFFLEEVKRHLPRATELNAHPIPGSTAYSFTDGKDFASGKNRYAYLDGRQNAQDQPHISLSAFAMLPPSDIAVPNTFATPERSYRLFVSACMARFPDIERIGEYVQDLGWRSPHAPQTTPFYHNTWNIWDPFDEMGSYLFDLWHSNAFKSCAIHFNLRAAVPMDRLIRDYALVQADTPQGFPPRPNEKFEYYTGRVGGMQAMFKLRTEDAIHSGDLTIYVEPPQ